MALRLGADSAVDGGGHQLIALGSAERRAEIGGPRSARIEFVSPRPEFTPPVIYSREARQRLVFLVEAKPEPGPALAPGQPVDIVPLDGSSKGDGR